MSLFVWAPVFYQVLGLRAERSQKLQGLNFFLSLTLSKHTHTHTHTHTQTVTLLCVCFTAVSSGGSCYRLFTADNKELNVCALHLSVLILLTIIWSWYWSEWSGEAVSGCIRAKAWIWRDFKEMSLHPDPFKSRWWYALFCLWWTNPVDRHQLRWSASQYSPTLLS